VRDPVQAMLNAIERDKGGVAVIWCLPDLGLRDWLVGEVESIVAADTAPIHVQDLEAALVEPSRLALLVPKDEREAVLDLDANRERLIETQRTQPIVLFLLRGGDGQRLLAAQPVSLASWIEGSDADPDELAQVDPRAEREAFQRDLGATPEGWLEGWREGSVPRTSENFRTAYRAMLLEVP